MKQVIAFARVLGCTLSFIVLAVIARAQDKQIVIDVAERQWPAAVKQGNMRDDTTTVKVRVHAQDTLKQFLIAGRPVAAASFNAGISTYSYHLLKQVYTSANDLQELRVEIILGSRNAKDPRADTLRGTLQFINNQKAGPAPALTPCERKTYLNHFKENIDHYDEDKVVYVYDHHPEMIHRGFYKVVRSGNSLVTKSVNLNREQLKPTANVQFKVYHVNRFLYDVELQDTSIEFYNDPPFLLSEYLLGNGDALQELSTGFLSDLSQLHAKDEDALTTETLDKLRLFYSIYNELKQQLADAYSPCAEFTCCDDGSRLYFRRLLHLSNDIRFNMHKLEMKMKEPVKIYNAMSARLAACRQTKAELKTAGEELDNLKTLIGDKEKQLTISALSAAERTALKKEIIELKKEQVTQETRINTLKNKECNEPGLQRELGVAAVPAEPYLLLQKIQADLPDEDKLRRALLLLDHLSTQNQSMSLDHISLAGIHQVDLWLSIRTRDTVARMLGIPRYAIPRIHIQLPVARTTTVNFSSGAFAAIGTYLQNKTYDWHELPGGGYRLAETGYTAHPLGLCAFANVEYKPGKSFGFGPSVGVGLTLEEHPRLAYLAGGSLFFGRTKQFMLTGGVAFMMIDRLRHHLESVASNGTVYPDRSLPLSYRKEFKTGLFASFSYCIYQVRKTTNGSGKTQ